MKAFSHLWQYLAEFFSEWQIYQIIIAEKIKIQILCPIIFFRKLRHFWDNVEKRGGARDVASDNMAALRAQEHARVRAVTHIRVHTHTHAPMRATPTEICTNFFHDNSGFVNVPQRHVIRTLLVFVFFYLSNKINTEKDRSFHKLECSKKKVNVERDSHCITGEWLRDSSKPTPYLAG